MSETRPSPDEWQTTFDALNDAVWVLDADQRVVRANRASAQLFQRRADEMIGMRCYEIIHGSTEPIPECPFSRMRASLRREHMDLQVGKRWFEVTVDPILDADQRLAGGVHIVSDITERVLAAEHVRRQNESLTLLIEISATLAGFHETPELLQALACGAAGLLPAGSAAIYMLDGETLRLAATCPELAPDLPEPLRLARLSDHPHIGRAISEDAPVILPDAQRADLTEAERAVSDLRGLRSLVYLPLAYSGRPFGVLVAGSVNEPYDYSDEEVGLFRALAAQASLEIEGVRLVEENRRHVAELERLAAQHVQTQETLRRSEALFRNLFEKHAAVKLLINPEDGQIVDANEAAAEFYGWPLEELRRMNISDINTLSPAELKNEMESVRRRRRVYFEFRHRLADGSTKDVAVYSSKIETEGRDLLHSIVHDITERKQAEEERERLRTAIEQTGEAIIITDPDGAIRYVNPVFTAVTGYSRSEVVGQNPRLLKSGEHDSVFYKELWETITAGRVWQGRLTNKRKDGALYTEEATISPVRDGSGRIVNYVAVKRDVTEQLREAEERSRLEEQLRQSQKVESIGRLAGGVAHDFNNMLSVILGYGEILLESLQPEDPMRESAQQIVEAGRRSAALTHQLLAFSRKQTLRPEVLRLNDVISNLEQMLRRLIGENIELRLDLSEGISPVLADRGQLEQVIVNLVVNARDAMPQGGSLIVETSDIELGEGRADDRLGAAPGEYALLAVSDTGAGMTADVVEQIFEPFFTTKGDSGGTGLGLSMVYGIVKQSGGHIGVHSEPGHGSTFKIYLPQARDAEEPAAGEIEVVAAGGDGGDGEHILVVEDERSLRELIRTILETRGFRVTLAADGAEALLLVEDEGLRPDLVLTDMIMPNLSGRQLTERLRSKQPHLRVLYMSGYTDSTVAEQGVLDATTPFIQKPFTRRSLLEKIEGVLESAQGREPDDKRAAHR